jgi:hypothetical protein
MEFWASSETDRASGSQVEACRLQVVPFMNAAFGHSSLADLEAKIRYIPIVMPKQFHEKFKARSKLRRKERLYDCSPQLDYVTFVVGTHQEQIDCYVEGLRECAARLPELGASKEQVADFLKILDQAKLELAASPSV